MSTGRRAIPPDLDCTRSVRGIRTRISPYRGRWIPWWLGEFPTSVHSRPGRLTRRKFRARSCLLGTFNGSFATVSTGDYDMVGWNITAFCRRTIAPHFVYHRARIKPRIDARTICYCRLAWRNYPLINNRLSFISSYDAIPVTIVASSLPFCNPRDKKENMFKQQLFFARYLLTDYDRCDRIEKWQIHFYHRNNIFFWVTYYEKLKERKYI